MICIDIPIHLQFTCRTYSNSDISTTESKIRNSTIKIREIAKDVIDKSCCECVSATYRIYGCPGIHHEVPNHECNRRDECEAGVEGVWGFHRGENYKK